MLKISDFSKSYSKGKYAVSSLSMEVRSGEICGFIGHNGAGKTTTLKAAAGILDFEEGEILIDGFSIRRQPIEAKRRLAYIPDNPDLYESMKGIKYLNFIADIYGVSKKDRSEQIIKYADTFGLSDALGAQVSSYSHGMKQKLSLIAALIHSPRLLMLDEPFVGLDPIASHNLKLIMKEMCRNGGAILFSTHVLEVAEKLCDRVVIIKNGCKVTDGTVAEVMGEKSLEKVFLDISDNEMRKTM